MVLIGMNGSELVLNGFQGQITLKKNTTSEKNWCHLGLKPPCQEVFGTYSKTSYARQMSMNPPKHWINIQKNMKPPPRFPVGTKGKILFPCFFKGNIENLKPSLHVIHKKLVVN